MIFYNAIIIWTTRVLLLVPQVIMVPFLIHRIGEAGYGAYALAWSLMMAIDQLQNSLQQGVIKYSAAFLAERRIDEVNKVVSSSFIYSILLAVVACSGLLSVAVFYSDPSGNLAVSLVVVGVLVLLTIPLTPYVAVIQSRQRYYVDALAGVVSKYVSLLTVVVWFGLRGPSIEVLIILSAGMLFLSRLAQVPIAYHLVPGLRNDPRLLDWRTFHQIVSFGGVVVLLVLCTIVNDAGIRWLMNTLVSTSFVTHLAIILMPGMLLNQIVQAMTITIMPAASAYEATGNAHMLKELLLRSMRYTSILVIAGMGPAMLLVRDALRLWVGPEYGFLVPSILVMFSSVAFLTTTSAAHHLLKGLGRLRITVIIALVGQVVVPIALICIVFWRWRNPYLAVTVGLATGNVVSGIVHIGFTAKAVHTGFREVFLRVYAQPLFLALAISILTLGLMTYGGMESLVERMGVSILVVLLFLTGAYLLLATAAERYELRELGQLALGQIARIRRMLPGCKGCGSQAYRNGDRDDW